ncbi:MAG: polysaccharide deacetylase family protein [Candidatus Pacebacteria bacterium]|nr:polysaccharide deacetylase family protein [Candidatus Paceibacterota bacterium]
MTGIRILMYHSISDSSEFFSVTSSEFEWQMRLLRQRNVESVFASQIPTVLKEGRSNIVCVTFDDGYEDMYSHAFPILQRYAIKATGFVITDILGKSYHNSNGAEFPVLTENQIQEMLASGLVEFMPHTQSHQNLDEVSLEAAIEEIEGSRKKIESLTGKTAAVFAYPRGRFTHSIVEHLRNNWSAAVTVERGIATASDDLFLLPRIAIDAVTTRRAFRAALDGSLGKYRLLKSLKAHTGISL